MDLGDLVARNARMMPKKEAVVFNDNRYTWGEVNEIVNTVANNLLAAGLRKGDKVAMWMFNSDMFIFAFYGIAKAGGVAVPVNFRLVPREAEYIFDNCDAMVIIADDTFMPAAQEMRPRLGKVAAWYSAGSGRFDGFIPLSDIFLNGDRIDPSVVVDEFDESEIIYTSGTTGKPKGALFVHHNQMVVTATMLSLVAFRPGDRILHAAPMFHSAELNLYMNPTTYVGATHVVIREFHPLHVLELIQKERITQFFGAPIMYSLMMGMPNFDTFDLSSVRHFGYGAAPMAAESVRQMIAKFKTDRFFCLCGLTEGGPGGVALYPEDQVRKAGAGGKYIVNMESRLVDAEGNTITKPGVVGELVLKGETCMREYYNNPKATAETIRNGWVHTGDLGKMDEEGYITLVDRIKDMIITGGKNVYSKEVEDAIYEHPAVAEAVIIGVPHPQWGETVVCVAVLHKEKSLTLEELRDFLKTRLAEYKIPRKLEIVPHLPRNVSGKVLKYQLRTMFK